VHHAQSHIKEFDPLIAKGSNSSLLDENLQYLLLIGGVSRPTDRSIPLLSAQWPFCMFIDNETSANSNN
jgi:hypothetical protein